MVVPVPVRQPGQPQGALRGHRARRSGATSPSSPTSSPGSAPPARSWASAASSRSATPTSRSGRSSRRRGRWSTGSSNIDEGFIPPVFLDNDGFELLDRRLIVRPRESIEWTRRLTEVGIFAGISSGAILAGAVKAAGPDRRGHDRDDRVRRRLEVPLRRACGPTTSTPSRRGPSPRSTSEPAVDHGVTHGVQRRARHGRRTWSSAAAPRRRPMRLRWLPDVRQLGGVERGGWAGGAHPRQTQRVDAGCDLRCAMVGMSPTVRRLLGRSWESAERGLMVAAGRGAPDRRQAIGSSTRATRAPQPSCVIRRAG